MEQLAQDLRFAARLLWKDRGFALTTVLTLSICIGANAAIFAIVNSVLLRPLPVPEPDRLVLLYNSLESLKVPLERGRMFNDSDTEKSPRVVIVDERLARKFWPGANPVGRRMYSPDNPDDLSAPGPKTQWITVVGVVGETKREGLVGERDRSARITFPCASRPYAP